ncbi:MAG: xylose isomerase, partial [Pseudomonadota bacterium]
MSSDYFKDLEPITFEGSDSANPMAFHHYDKDEVVMGKRMEDHLRFGIAYWHSF